VAVLLVDWARESLQRFSDREKWRNETVIRNGNETQNSKAFRHFRGCKRREQIASGLQGTRRREDDCL